MVVRATVTSPETREGGNLIVGVVPVEEGFSGPLFLRSPLGVALPTQQIVGMRGPGGVVRTLELRALATSPPGGGSQTYTVEDGSVLSGASFHAHLDFTFMCEAPDTAGNPAIVTFSSRLLQAGANTGSAGDVTRTIIRSGEMQSDSGSKLFGFRAHVTTVAGVSNVWLVDMAFQNGNVGTPGAPLGAAIQHDVFFNEIRLSMPAGYSLLHLLQTPYTTSNKLMGPDPSGKLHPLKQGALKFYRFAIHTAASFVSASILLNRFGAFVCDHSTTLWSWSNPATAWYGPHARLVPQKNLTSFHPYQQPYSAIASGLATGTPIPFQTSGGPSTPLGPFHVRNVTDGGHSSGDGITAFKGYEVVNGGSLSKLKAHMAILSMDADRSASSQSPGYTGICLCGPDQAPIRVSDWDLTGLCFINNPGALNSNHQGPWPRLNASQWRLQHAQQNNMLPGYYTQLGNFGLYKDSHLIRPMGACVPLICLQNDPLAKDYIAHLAPWCRAHTLEYGPNPSKPQSAGGSLWWSYEGSPQNVQDWQGKGARKGSELSGRIGGWAIFAQMLDWLSTSDDTKRAGYDAWFAMLKEHHTLAQISTGSRNWHAMDSLGDHPVLDLLHQWNANGNLGSPNAAASQIIECGIQAGALLCVHAATGDDDWLAMLANACAGMYDYHRKTGTGTYHFVAPVRPIDITGGDPWATQAEAPDCFTEPPSGGNPLGLDYDNDQVGTLIAAALEHDPAHPQAWAAIYAMTGEATPEAARDALLALFPSKMEESWGTVLAWLQDFTEGGQINVTPSPAVMGFTAVAPDVDVHIEVTPSPAIMGFEAVPPEVEALRVDEIVVRPEPVVMGFDAVPPESVEAGINIEPSPAIMAFVLPLASVTIQDEVEPPPAIMGFVAVPIWNIEAGGVPGVSATLSITLQVEEAVQIATSVEQSTQAAMEVSQTLVIDYP